MPNNFHLGTIVEVDVDNRRFPGVVTTFRYAKSIAENSDTLFLGPNLKDFISLDDWTFVVMPNLYVANVKEEYCSDPKYIGSFIVLPINEIHLIKKSTELGERIYKEFFADN